MYTLLEVDGKLVARGKFGDSTIDVVHCNETISEIQEDSATPYIVAEECTNFARLHLVTDFSEDEALQQVDTYLREKEDVVETHIIAVIECELEVTSA